MRAKCVTVLGTILTLSVGNVFAETGEGDLKVRFLGINGFEFTIEGETLLIDPYVSRDPRQVSIPEVVRKHIPKADYIVLTHSHWDHLADVAEIAQYTDAVIAGSETTLNICQYFKIPESRLRLYRNHEEIRLGRFTVTPIRSKHKEPVGYPGRYDEVPARIASVADYVEGGTWALLVACGEHTFLNVGSANLIDEELRGIKCDYLLASIAGRGEDYLPRLHGCVEAKVFVPVHWDDFSGRPVEDTRERISLSAFQQEMKAIAPDQQIRVLQVLETLRIERP